MRGAVGYGITNRNLLAIRRRGSVSCGPPARSVIIGSTAPPQADFLTCYARAESATSDSTACPLKQEFTPSTAKSSPDKLGKVRRGIHDWFGKRTQARAGADIAGDHQKVSRVVREAINGRINDNITVGKGTHQLLSFGRTTVAPVIFSRRRGGNG
jgi:hypothetical protein